MATALHHLSDYDFDKVPDASNMCFGIVVAEWNPTVTGALLDGAVNTLKKHGAIPENIHVKTVPGSFELIYGARQMVLNGGYDAVIILGSVIRGETPHFDYICEGVTYGIARLNATQEIPVIYGLLTTNDLQQALDRCGGKFGNKGDECAVVAIKMAQFLQAFEFEEIFPEVTDMFPNAPLHREVYEKAFNILCDMKPAINKQVIKYELRKDSGSGEMFVGADDSNFDAAWELLLGKDIKKEKGVDLSDNEIAANCLLNVLFIGHHPKSFDDEYRKLRR